MSLLRPSPFIVGVPRSGTTLLRMMLDAHPDLAIPPETHFPRSLFCLQGNGHAAMQRFYDVIVRSPRWQDFHIPKREFYNEISGLNPFSVSEGLRCFYALYAARFGKTRWGDKTPGYYSMMLAIQAILPEAHFINVVRDGRDVWLSERKTWWGKERTAAEHAKCWRHAVLTTAKEARSCHHFLDLRYDNLVLKPTEQLKCISRFLDLEYDPAMESYFETCGSRIAEVSDLVRPDNGEIIIRKADRISSSLLVITPPDSSRLECWKKDMTRADCAQYCEIAGDVLEALGFET
jgi:hypothetical protein